MPFKDPQKKREWAREWWKSHPEKKREYQRTESAKNRAPLRSVNCECCGKRFETRLRKAKFCSRKCGRKSYRARHLEEIRIRERRYREDHAEEIRAAMAAFRKKHSKRLNRESYERYKRRRATDAERVLTQRREYRRRYRATHRERVRAVNREKKRREDARLMALTIDQIVELIKRRGETEWSQRLSVQLLRKVRKQARGDH